MTEPKKPRKKPRRKTKSNTEDIIRAVQGAAVAAVTLYKLAKPHFKRKPKQ